MPRIFPDGMRQAAILGELLAPGQRGVIHVYVLDLASGQMRRLSTGAANDSSATSLARGEAGTRKSVLLARRAEDLTEIVSLPAFGGGSPRVLFTTSDHPWQCLDSSPDGAVYAG